jgi:hypothetical protein
MDSLTHQVCLFYALIPIFADRRRLICLRTFDVLVFTHSTHDVAPFLADWTIRFVLGMHTKKDNLQGTDDAEILFSYGF